jgi:multiple sugar transport system ATP-binding protein
MNFLPGTVRGSGPQARIELEDGSLVEAPPGSTGSDGQAVIFGTRPEHLELVSEGGIAMQVAVVEPTGADTFVACRHGSKEHSVVFHDRHAFQPGSTIRLKPDLPRAHLFDAGTGRRLAS